DLSVRYSTKDGPQHVEAEAVLVAVSRAPLTKGVWTEEVPLEMNGRAIKVDMSLKTNLPGVYAIGEVALMPMLAHTAYAQADVVVENLKGNAATYDDRVIPNCVFTIPEIAGVGLTEEQAREQHGEVRIGTFPFAAIARPHILNQTQGVVKLIAS